MVLTPNNLFSWNNKYSKYTIILSRLYTLVQFTLHLPAVHINLLCACWHSEAVKGSSSLSTRRLLISLWVTSSLFLCPEPTDAPCPYYEDPVRPLPKMAPPFTGSAHTPFSRVRDNYGARFGESLMQERVLNEGAMLGACWRYDGGL